MACGLLAIHLLLRWVYSENSVLVDLILFNLVGLISAAIALNTPIQSDRSACLSFGLATLIWSCGSFFSTWNSFFVVQIPEGFSDFCYAIFYPLVFFGVTRSFAQKKSISSLEVLDTVIVAVGFTSVLTAFFLKPAMIGLEGSAWQVFISILYPVGDIVLLAMVVVYLLLSSLNFKSILLASGLLLFATSDLYFIWSSLNDTYNFGSISDDGWIAGLLLLAISLYFPTPNSKVSEKVSSYSATIALIASSVLLGIAALKPGYFPSFILIPGFITIALAFIRMSFALHEANTAVSERVLARTDELTGLSNRRNFLLHLSQLKSGFIFLLDLDGFKKINDELGHAAGDELLRQVAMRFSRVIPSGAQLARLGGDEFGVIAQIDHSQANELAQALGATLSYPISLPAGGANVNVSIGFAPIDAAGVSADWLRQADLAMYSAKRNGLGYQMWSSNIENLG
jgi:diguanylate cyclase (GGDEF)-like protein